MFSPSRTTRKAFTKTSRRCSKSSLFSPHKESLPTLEDWELNRGRVELRATIGSQSTDPEEVAFTSAAQIVCLNRRVLRNGKMSNESVHLISSLEPQRTPCEKLKQIKRDYWSIESDLHYRLDEVLDEDRSRVRTPKAAFVLGMCRRLAVSFAIPWIAKRKKKHKRTSTRDFLDHLRAGNAGRAFDLVTAKSPTSWKI